jgi:hypothetical protein
MSNKRIDFMVDIETTSLDPQTGAIIQLGCVAFNVHDFTIISKFEASMLIPENKEWSPSTHAWWHDGGAMEEKLKGIMEQASNPKDVMLNWYQWMVELAEHCYPGAQQEHYCFEDTCHLWAKPSLFDIQYLQAYWRDYMASPWPFSHRHHHDVGTYCFAVNPQMDMNAFPRDESKTHTALYDCELQIDMMRQARKLADMFGEQELSPAVQMMASLMQDRLNHGAEKGNITQLIDQEKLAGLHNNTLQMQAAYADHQYRSLMNSAADLCNYAMALVVPTTDTLPKSKAIQMHLQGNRWFENVADMQQEDGEPRVTFLARESYFSAICVLAAELESAHLPGSKRAANLRVTAIEAKRWEKKKARQAGKEFKPAAQKDFDETACEIVEELKVKELKVADGAAFSVEQKTCENCGRLNNYVVGYAATCIECGNELV